MRPSYRLLLPLLIVLLAFARVGAAQGPAGQLVFRNGQSIALVVELHAGPAASCASNPLVVTRTVEAGRTWTLSLDQPVCWRTRPAPAASAAAWSAWQTKAVAAGTSEEVAL